MPTAVTRPALVFNFMVTMWDVSGPSVFGGGAVGSALGGALSAVSNLAGQMLFGGFSEVQGLNLELETETYQEGGNNAHPHRFVKYARHPNLVFKRGITFNTDLADWYAQVLGPSDDQVVRKDGMIVLMDRGGLNLLPGPIVGGLDRIPIAAWKFTRGIPEKLDGPQLNGKGNDVAIETLEISHEGLQRVSPSMIPGIGSLFGAFGGGLSIGVAAGASAAALGATKIGGR
jgi:phage tail-like protein